MRRRTVPEVAPLVSDRAGDRLLAMLDDPQVAPVYDRQLQPLAGVWWPRPIRQVASSGDIAMFELEDAGELQEWGARS